MLSIGHQKKPTACMKMNHSPIERAPPRAAMPPAKAIMPLPTPAARETMGKMSCSTTPRRSPKRYARAFSVLKEPQSERSRLNPLATPMPATDSCISALTSAVTRLALLVTKRAMRLKASATPIATGAIATRRRVSLGLSEMR